ncbi:unnamed protein product [Rotaria magnacalcarata]|uniref:Uncharacterized protein n=2 Tax=Rotaria TaxID=231623 RepID=A0A816Z9P5_9BILA|nr:unnamed protein product [Rotaria magnacalcarata]CAF3395266.1 unnamed protein product [Rotaria socialis]CAF4151308.1 unnamed protein product [Rotaria magnacalcarata]CAF4896902.1 unnamed protein product [Rotaria socialis]
MDSHTKFIRQEDVGLVKTDVFLGLDGELIQAHALNPDLDQDLILDQSIWMLGQNRMMYRTVPYGRGRQPTNYTSSQSGKCKQSSYF